MQDNAIAPFHFKTGSILGRGKIIQELLHRDRSSTVQKTIETGTYISVRNP